MDASNFYQTEDQQDMLIRNTSLGQALARHFGKSEAAAQEIGHAIVLMRGHGMTVVARGVRAARNLYAAERAHSDDGSDDASYISVYFAIAGAEIPQC